MLILATRAINPTASTRLNQNVYHVSLCNQNVIPLIELKRVLQFFSNFYTKLGRLQPILQIFKHNFAFYRLKTQGENIYSEFLGDFWGSRGDFGAN